MDKKRTHDHVCNQRGCSLLPTTIQTGGTKEMKQRKYRILKVTMENNSIRYWPQKQVHIKLFGIRIYSYYETLSYRDGSFTYLVDYIQTEETAREYIKNHEDQIQHQSPTKQEVIQIS